MTHVSILVPHGSAVMESVVSVFTILDQANDHALAAGGDALFDVHLVGATNRVELYGGRSSVRPDLRLGETHATDLVIVPALGWQPRRGTGSQRRMHSVDPGAVPCRRGNRRSVHRRIVHRGRGIGQ